ncbi:hypothetical protein EDB84DRAFT_1452714 [Lactarius hengduanensis]|nr:hypothetical protein EDB84DRAFT_1452714 [Lactarius hengduanensis]
MPLRPRKIRRDAAQPRGKENKAVLISDKPTESPQIQRKEPKSHLYILLVFPILLLMILHSLVTFLYGRVLDPLYGSIPINLHLDKVVWAATFAGAFGPVPSLWSSLAIHGGLVASIPISSYYTALYAARINGPSLGSTLTHLVVLFPVLYVGVSMVKRMATLIETSSSENSTARFTILPACATSVTGLQVIWGALLDSYRFGLSDNEILFILGGIGLALYASSSAFVSVSSPRRENDEGESFPSTHSSRLVPGLAAILFPLLLWRLGPPVLPQPLTEPYTHPSFPLRILSSVPSVTGIIVVGETLPSDTGTPESYPSSLRYLRASHSILGGVWIGDKISQRASGPAFLDAKGTPLGDSIYSAFVLQEAVRLIDTRVRAIRPGQEKALFIGLGAGIAVSSFARQKIDTTVIEIDPAVYNASRQYFGLPDLGSGRVFIRDARAVVAEKRLAALQHSTPNVDKYDYVVHDCFSGGGVPAHLFTVIMNPDGVVAVNFAGKIDSHPAKAILFTLQRSFGQCRVFHDLPPDQLDSIHSFVNLVFFCSPSTKPLVFRSPSEPDYSNSYLRAAIFDTLQEREVDLKHIRGDTRDGDALVLSDTKNQLAVWQQDGALEHWRLMQSVFPEPFWATY